MMTLDNIKACLDHIEDGLIVVDRQKTIVIYNKRAREIFGIDYHSGPGHPAGKVAPGDIVVIGDTCLGADDGGLEPEDLSVVGLSAHAVNKGDALVLAGRYQTPGTTPFYQVAAGGILRAPLALSCCIHQRDRVAVVIDDFIKNISISVNDSSFNLRYNFFIHHLVILDGSTGEVKFYQTLGYTAKGEDVRQILRGKEFLGKGPNIPDRDIIGRPIANIHPDDKGTYYFDLVLDGQSKAVEQKEYMINGIWVRLSSYSLYDEQGEVLGAALVFRDINELKLLEHQVQNRGFKYPAFEKIKGNSPSITEAIKVAQRVSKSKSTMLLLGESGTGKGLFARAIHDNSDRAAQPFVTVNVAAIPGALLESELFGYEEGAFTGAKRGGEVGKIRLANGGTLFLDEIGEMDFYLQAKILHFLEEDSFYPVGSSRLAKVDIRVIAATNKNLEQAVKQGRFREDLFYRLNVVSLILPPLRQRKSDIRELVDCMLPLIRKKVGRRNVTVSPEVYEDFLAYDWPGNVRELENILERAANMMEGTVIDREVLPDDIINCRSGSSGWKFGNSDGDLKDWMETAEREAIIGALKATHYNKTAAIRKLGIGRTAFYEKVRKHQIVLQE